MNFKKHILATYEKKIVRNWDTIYWAIDIHDTCVVANYKSGDIPTEFFPYAKKVLQRLSKRTDTKLFLYTCSHPHEIEQYFAFFNEHKIKFHWCNENPEAVNTAYGFFDKKPYSQILLDDKAGFDPFEDWKNINEALIIIDNKIRNKKWTEDNKDRYLEYHSKYRSDNKDLIKEKNKKFLDENPDYRRIHLYSTYGITLEEFNELLDKQDGVCAICKLKTDGHWHVDHDHQTEKVRGVLCFSCNTSLGRLNENITTLNNMIAYIEKHKNTTEI